jgi:hypothetical protein
MDFYIQKILANDGCVKSRTFSLKTHEACKLFLLVLEDYLRITYWSGFYHSSTAYTCFDLFRDYYDSNPFLIDRNKLFIIEQEIWNEYMSINTNNNIHERRRSSLLMSLDNMLWTTNYCEDEINLNIDFDGIKPRPCASADISPKKKFITFKTAKTSPRKKQKPVLKELIIKFTKRENVDKKIFRRFRKFVKDTPDELVADNKFWQLFAMKNLLPPVDYSDPAGGESVCFKSFNTSYSMWLFGHKDSVTLYEKFLQANGNFIISLYKELCKSKEEENELKMYIYNLAYIYAPSNSNSESSDDILKLSQCAVDEEDNLQSSNKVLDLNFDIDDE